jgi:hypothetical protein
MDRTRMERPMPAQDQLSVAIQGLCDISGRDMARFQACQSAPERCLHEAAFCDAVTRYGVVEAFESYLHNPTLETHGQLSTLLNLLLRRSANPTRGESQPPVPSHDFGRAVIRALVVLGSPE